MSRLAARLAAAVVALAGLGAQAQIVSSVDAATLPKGLQTPLGLYLTPRDAAAALRADPGIVFIDVRDPIEVAFVGLAEPADANVPVAVFTHAFDPKKGGYVSKPNPAFVAQVDAVMARLGKDRDDPVFVMCRSGGRSAVAAAQLVKAGYANVWNIVEGFEGDMNKATGRRDLNGWRNAGLPSTYRIDPAVAWTPSN